MGDYQRAKALFERDLAAFQRSNAYIGWRREAEVESLRLANGIFASETYDEFREIWDDYFYEVDSIVKPRSQIYECYLEDSCENYAKSYEPADIYRLSIAEVESLSRFWLHRLKKRLRSQRIACVNSWICPIEGSVTVAYGIKRLVTEDLFSKLCPK